MDQSQLTQHPEEIALGFTREDVKLMLCTFFSALLGVTLLNAIACIGNGCWTTDMRDIITAVVSIIIFFIIYHITATYHWRRRSRSSRRRTN